MVAGAHNGVIRSTFASKVTKRGSRWKLEKFPLASRASATKGVIAMAQRENSAVPASGLAVVVALLFGYLALHETTLERYRPP